MQANPEGADMPRITLVGAGSMVFAKTLVGDILSFSKLADSEIVLMDIDERRLEQTARVARAMVENGDVGATIEATTDRREALSGADYVLNMIKELLEANAAYLPTFD